MNFFVTRLLIVMSLGLSGCSLLDLKQNSKVLDSKLSQMQYWQIRGKLSVINKGEAVTGFLTWQQNQQKFDIFLSGPFGQGSSHLVGNEQQASLTLPGEETVYASSADALMEQFVGWKFPVLDVRHWVKGQASPNSTATEARNSMGLLEKLQQHGWQVQFSRYQRLADNWLPGRVKIIGNEFTFVLAIKEWDIHAQESND